ncbi:MAG: hypothetical protein RL681_279 [Candidatus Parcubacteria bacterium]|jgi:hypothetical protein
MRIRWREVTWYSRLIAAGLFVLLPFIGFWLGIQYARSLGPLAMQVVEHPSQDGSATNGTSQSTSSFNEPPKTVLGKTVVAIPGTHEFVMKTLPGVTFTVEAAGRLSGGVPVPACGAGSFFYLPDPDDSRKLGSCIDTRKLSLPGETPGIAYAVLRIDNKSNGYVNGRFLQLFWNSEHGEALESSLADNIPRRDSYGALPFSSRRTVIGFLVPAGQEQIQLVFGEYGKAPGIAETQETLLGKSVGGWIVNFVQKTMSDIPG